MIDIDEVVRELRREHFAVTPFRPMAPTPVAVEARYCSVCEGPWPCRVSQLLDSWGNIFDQLGVCHMDALRLQEALTNTRTHLNGIRAAGVAETDRLCFVAGLGTWDQLIGRIDHALLGDRGGDGTRTAKRSVSVDLAIPRSQVHEVSEDTPARGPTGAGSTPAGHHSIDQIRMASLLARFVKLVNRALVVVTHNKPTAAEAAALVDEGRSLLGINDG